MLSFIILIKKEWAHCDFQCLISYIESLNYQSLLTVSIIISSSNYSSYSFSGKLSYME